MSNVRLGESSDMYDFTTGRWLGVLDQRGNEVYIPTLETNPLTGEIAALGVGNTFKGFAPIVFRPQDYAPTAGRSDLVNDDTEALQWAINQAKTVSGTVDLGSGKYRVTANIGALITQKITVKGDGYGSCLIYIDPTMTGDLLSFSNTWYGSDAPIASGGTPTAGNRVGDLAWQTWGAKKSGVSLYGFTVIGDRRTSATQNGIMFYDRNDDVFHDVNYQFIKGTALCLSGIPSVPANNKASLMRESTIKGHIRWCGDASTVRPAVVMNSSSKDVDTGDDANNYNDIDLKVVYSDGLAVQYNCYNLFSNQMSNNRVKLIVDFPNKTYLGSTNSGFNSITNGVWTVSAGVTQIGTIAVNQFISNPNVPPGTYVSAILTGSGGVGTYQLAHKNHDLSTLTVSSGTLAAVRYGVPAVQIGGGHVGEKWNFTLNASNALGTGSAGFEWNQNILGASQPKTQLCDLELSTGSIDIALLFVVINSMHVSWRIRSSATGITALNISQSVTVNLGEHLASAEIAIGGTITNLHVYPGNQLMFTALPTATKYPNAVINLNTTGVYTRHWSNGTSWITI